MDNDLPAEPNDYMAAAYSELAHQARMRARVGFNLEHMLTMADSADRLQNLADLYATRRELTTGELPK